MSSTKHLLEQAINIFSTFGGAAGAGAGVGWSLGQKWGPNKWATALTTAFGLIPGGSGEAYHEYQSMNSFGVMAADSDREEDDEAYKQNEMEGLTEEVNQFHPLG
jgi:hypothetical protein